jgi:uncharacterized phage protein gp47/JayE
MAEFGVTDSGFVLKRLQDILNEQRQKAVELFQDLVEPGDIVDTSDSSALGRLIAIDSGGDADLWEVAQMVYSAFDPNSATGIALDNLVAYGGIARQGESASTAIGLFTGDNGSNIPLGSTVSSPVTSNQFTTSELVLLSPVAASVIVVTVFTVQNSTAYTITYSTGPSSSNTVTFTSDASATESEILNGLLGVITGSHPLLSASVVGTTLVVNKADVFQTSNFSVSSNLAISKVSKTGGLVATVIGPLEQEADTITNIVTPVLGWDSVTNPLAASPGRLQETDEELRLRFRNTKFERSTNLLDSLYSALLNLEGVEEVIIYENDTSVTDSNGVPGHSFLPIIIGASGQQIAETIWENKPIGILSYGNTTVSINDIAGFPHDISFQRPDPVTIYISMTIQDDPTIFPANGADLIKQAIIDYADENIGIGDDVIYSRLYTPINSVPGHQVNSLTIGFAPAPIGTSNLVIDFDSIASFTTANISVTVV